MKSQPGTYVFVLKSRKRMSVRIGRWGNITIVPGYYIYVGSAFGPGGVKARVSRHFRTKKSCHWHIDYLREHTDPVLVWYRHTPVRMEHQWAHALSNMKEASPIKGFGCSDCTCCSHLFAFKKKPTIARFTSTLGVLAGLYVYTT